MDAAARESMKRAGGEADIECDDILASMAATLIQDNSQVYSVDVQPDTEPPQMLVGAKPPKEVFYRKTQLFSTQIPQEVGPKRCTCKYLCHGAPATIKCLSCVMYDPKNLAFFCKACFDSRHPWYRVPHVFDVIAKDESVGHSLKVSHRRAEMVRFTSEYEEQMKELMDNKPKIDFVADDHRAAWGLKDAGARTMALEKRMQDFRKNIRADIRSKTLESDHKIYPNGKYHLDLLEDEAQAIIAKYYRGYKVRHVLSMFLTNRVVRGVEVKNGKTREFFFDKMTKKSSWKKPVLLLHSHMDKLKMKVHRGSGKGTTTADISNLSAINTSSVALATSAPYSPLGVVSGSNSPQRLRDLNDAMIDDSSITSSLGLDMFNDSIDNLSLDGNTNTQTHSHTSTSSYGQSQENNPASTSTSTSNTKSSEAIGAFRVNNPNLRMSKRDRR